MLTLKNLNAYLPKVPIFLLLKKKKYSINPLHTPQEMCTIPAPTVIAETGNTPNVHYRRMDKLDK